MMGPAGPLFFKTHYIERPPRTNQAMEYVKVPIFYALVNWYSINKIWYRIMVSIHRKLFAIHPISPIFSVPYISPYSNVELLS